MVICLFTAHYLVELLEYSVQLRGLSWLTQAKLGRIGLDECLELNLEILHPIDSEEVLEGGVTCRIWNVRQGVVSQEFIGLREFGPLRVEVLFEFRLCLRKLLVLVPALQVLQVLHDVWVLSVHDEVNLEVELELLILKILLFHVCRNERIE